MKSHSQEPVALHAVKFISFRTDRRFSIVSSISFLTELVAHENIAVINKKRDQFLIAMDFYYVRGELLTVK